MKTCVHQTRLSFEVQGGIEAKYDENDGMLSTLLLANVGQFVCHDWPMTQDSFQSALKRLPTLLHVVETANKKADKN